jgi:hypothetical protein
MRQRSRNVTETQQPGFMKQILNQCFYLLEKSLDRYGRLKKSGAPDIVVDAEKVLIQRRLLFLFNIDKDATD